MGIEIFVKTFVLMDDTVVGVVTIPNTGVYFDGISHGFQFDNNGRKLHAKAYGAFGDVNAEHNYQAWLIKAKVAYKELYHH